MAAALESGWDAPAPPRSVSEPSRTGHAWRPPPRALPRPLPRAPQQQTIEAEVIIGARDETVPELPEEDEKTCPEAARDGCKSCMSSFCAECVDFLAAWFGAVHLQHLSEADEGYEMDHPRAAAAMKVREQALEESTLRSNFKRINPKVKAKKHWSGSARVRGWDGDPQPRPHSTEYWKHQYGLREDEEVVTRQYLPLFTITQCLVCFLLWIIFHWRDGTEEAGLESIFPLQTDLAVNSDCTDLRSEIWRWWTYQFTHVGIGHIGMNCVMTFVFGFSLEGVHGWFRLFPMFNVGVFGGACCYFFSDVHTRVVGMSGGCYALVGMHVGDVLMNFKEQQNAAKRYKAQEGKKDLDEAWKKMIMPPSKKILALMGFVLLDLIQGYLTRGSGVSHSAHVGGAVAGFLICVVFGQNLVVRGFEYAFYAAAFATGAGLVIFSLSWGMSWPPREIWDGTPWCWGRQIANSTVFGDLGWRCVRCADDACIARWSTQQYIAPATDRLCSAYGGWAVTER